MSVGVPVPFTGPLMAAPVSENNSISNSTLYVGDLESNVTEAQLYDLFTQIAPVVSIRVCRDHMKNISLGYAYINFNNPIDAFKAKEAINFSTLNGRPMRIMFSQRDPSKRKTGAGNVFIKNIDVSIDNKTLYNTFVPFGNITSCKVVLDFNGKSRGYGFVQFDKQESANNAIQQLDGMLLNGKPVSVHEFIRRQVRNPNATTKFTNVYVKNLSEDKTEADLEKIFGVYGTITSSFVSRDGNEKSRGFGFVNYETPEEAADAVEKLNGAIVDGNGDKALYVGKAQRKYEREIALKEKFESEKIEKQAKLIGTNLYIKNIEDSVSEEDLKELFAKFGTVKSHKIMTDEKGISKGCGFVAFSSTEEAAVALREMNGKMCGRKPLYVALAQRKEERTAWLQRHFSQQHHMARPLRMAPPPFNMYYNHQNLRPVAYHQPQFMRSGGIQSNPGPNFMVPFHPIARPMNGFQQGRGTGYHNPRPFVKNMNPRFNRGNEIAPYNHHQVNGVAQISVPASEVNNGVAQISVPASEVNNGVAQISVPASDLTTALASASPQDRTLMLGQQLFPLVNQLKPNYATKVTGMLLEMDQNEVLHLIESPEVLKEKVDEAIEVIRAAAAHADGDNKVNANGEENHTKNKE